MHKVCHCCELVQVVLGSRILRIVHGRKLFFPGDGVNFSCDCSCGHDMLFINYAVARALCSSLFWKTFINKQRWRFFSPPGSLGLTVPWQRRHCLLVPLGYWLTLIARSCIISTLLMLVLVCGSQTTSAYSSIGWPKLVYASSLASAGALYIKCLMPPRIFFNFVPFSFICMSNLSSDWIVPPRYLMLSVQSEVVIPKDGLSKAYCLTLSFIDRHSPFHWPSVNSICFFLIQ